jgi:hypothetical protein
MTIPKADPVPELCKHFDPAECTQECHEKARIFDEWLRGKLKIEGNDNASAHAPNDGDD